MIDVTHEQNRASSRMRYRNLIALAAALSFAAALAPHAATPPHEAADVAAGLKWRLVGPFRGGWSTMVAGVPSQPDVFWFGAAGGGVWKTENAGRTWAALFDHGPAASIGAIAVSPSNPNTVYIGTGQPEPRYDI